MSAGKRPPRFLPTLTEVVLPASQVNQEIVQTQCSSTERLSEQVITRLQQQLSDAIAQIVREHLVSFESQIQCEINSVVRAALAQALARGEGDDS